MVTENYKSEYPVIIDINKDSWHHRHGVITTSLWSCTDQWRVVKKKYSDMFDIRNVADWPNARKYKLNRW